MTVKPAEFNISSVSAAGLAGAEDDPRISSPLTSPYTSASASALFGPASGRGGRDGSRGSTPPTDDADTDTDDVEGNQGKRTGGYSYEAERPLAYLTTVIEREGLGRKDGEAETETEKKKGMGGFGWWKTGKEKKEKEVRLRF